MTTKDLDAKATTVRLADTKDMLSRIASAMIAAHGEYKCMVDGKPTKVVK